MEETKKVILSKANLLRRAIEAIDFSAIAVNRPHSIIKHTPWHTIPNVRYVKVYLACFDPIFQMFGILKRRRPAELEFQSYKNKSMNRFINHQVQRLSVYRSAQESRKYWRLAQCLMRRSNIWRVMAINHVFPQWQRNQGWYRILNMNRKLSQLINSKSSTLDFKRVYIPKTETTVRPLGVPTPEWRLYLHMYSCFLTFWLSPGLETQHGFIPGRGTLTAWKDIMTKGLWKKAYIYEWDFKGFFDSIHVNMITHLLIHKYSVPKEVAYFLENVNNSPIKLPVVQELDESKHIWHKKTQEEFSKGIYNPENPIFVKHRERLKTEPGYQDHVSEVMELYGLSNVFEYVQMEWVLSDSEDKGKIETYFNGVPQGAPTSPILANLIMQIWVEENKKKGHEMICYADDSITFSDHPISMSVPEGFGLEVNPSKSGYVKYDGKWLNPLKFLGLELTNGEYLSARTRKGSNMELTQEEIKLINLKEMTEYAEYNNISDLESWLDSRLSEWELFDEGNSPEKLRNQRSFQNMFKSKLWGFVQARLYSGTWNLGNLIQDFELKYRRNSWVDIQLKKNPKLKLDVFNSSSYASYSLASILRYRYKKFKQLTEL